MEKKAVALPLVLSGGDDSDPNGYAPDYVLVTIEHDTKVRLALARQVLNRALDDLSNNKLLPPYEAAAWGPAITLPIQVLNMQTAWVKEAALENLPDPPPELECFGLPRPFEVDINLVDWGEENENSLWHVGPTMNEVAVGVETIVLHRDTLVLKTWVEELDIDVETLPEPYEVFLGKEE